MKARNHLDQFLRGMADLWPVSPRAYQLPTGGGFARDRAALGEDWRNVGRDMRHALKKHEQTSADSC